MTTIQLKEIKGRIRRIRARMEEKGVGALFLSGQKNILYTTGKESGRVLLTRDEAILFLKELYKEIDFEFYFQKNYGFEIREIDNKKKSIVKTIKKLKIKKLCVENLMIEEFNKLKKELKISLIPTNLVESVRAIKSAYEISLLKKSANIAKKGMNKAYEIVKPDIREIDAVAEIEFFLRKMGSEKPSFESGALLSSGKNSANIHALSTTKKIKKNSFVIVDLGACFHGYHSDMTRTIKIGPSSLNKKDELLFEFVKNLELVTIDKIKEDMKAKEIHNFIENEIKRIGYKFYHSSGHGIGLDIHELPNINNDSKDILKEGMVFTIEPGIYLPKKFGIRFEDMVLIKKGGRIEILTK